MLFGKQAQVLLFKTSALWAKILNTNNRTLQIPYLWQPHGERASLPLQGSHPQQAGSPSAGPSLTVPPHCSGSVRTRVHASPVSCLTGTISCSQPGREQQRFPRRHEAGQLLTSLGGCISAMLLFCGLARPPRSVKRLGETQLNNEMTVN